MSDLAFVIGNVRFFVPVSFLGDRRKRRFPHCDAECPVFRPQFFSSRYMSKREEKNFRLPWGSSPPLANDQREGHRASLCLTGHSTGLLEFVQPLERL